MNLIFKAVLFVLPIMIYMISMLALNTPRLDDFSVELGETKNLIIGDSHLKYSLDPEIVENSASICTSAEPMLLSYFKLRYIFQSQNQNLKKVLLGVGYHNLTIADETKYKSKKWAAEMYTRTAPIMDRDMKISYLPFSYSEFLKHYVMMLLFKPIDRNFLIEKTYGGFVKSKVHRLTEKNLDEVIQRHFYEDEEIMQTSENLPRLLRDITLLCQINQVELYLINTPVHENYLDRIPKEIVENHKVRLEKLQLEFPNTIRLVETTSFALPDSAYLDYDHLNRYGSEIYSEYFNNSILD